MLTDSTSGFRLHVCVLSCFSCVRICRTLWTIAYQVPLSNGFSQQKYWSGLPFPPPWDLPDLGIKPASLCLLHWQEGSLTIVSPGKPGFRLQESYYVIITEYYNITIFLFSIFMSMSESTF